MVTDLRRQLQRVVTFGGRLWPLALALCLALCPTVGSADSQASPGTPRVRIAVLGDSLSAGYGLDPAEAFPARLEKALCERGHAVEVLNAGVSGDTTAGGLARLDWTLAAEPDLVLLELGGNDALRGIDPESVEQNLDGILVALEKRQVRVLLAGMRAPRSLGAGYEKSFNAVFPRLAERHQVAFYPFFLAGVAGNPAFNQPDGIHPNAAGVAEITRRILPLVEQLVVEIHQGGIRPNDRKPD
ncbi:arylesterase [Desulfuromonas versatilis]|uniref:Arylesterase n=1 Tax=Desulfuromonas versatilis TaxID=2802975 RepID=A0ABM8HP84_9BACT|nr:arylesterase [Desulfuromonas versatilis]BCR03424.1 arylesterase [Desulfuromonas versatilis]